MKDNAERIREVCEVAPMNTLSVQDTAHCAEIMEEENPVPVAPVSKRENAEAFVRATELILALLDQTEQLRKENECLKLEVDALGDALHASNLRQVDLMAQIDSGVETYGKDTAQLQEELKQLRYERDGFESVVQSLMEQNMKLKEELETTRGVAIASRFGG